MSTKNQSHSKESQEMKWNNVHIKWSQLILSNESRIFVGEQRQSNFLLKEAGEGSSLD